ncbi:hypothetical protein OPT61_g5172 [Boeremia exigua]|uniref:Uncharacterized protein n=1 Tax=Boeremia exigua TaxID=749465 RepID=A0ACC2IBF5_9PLEO|nr:hypothetical protein OPT61_g5172 [Boeremia exigua]
MAEYEYDGLTSNAFRYMVLLPGVSGDPLRCSLHTSHLDQARFEAVSYVWGTDHRTHDIVCDGKVMKITSNLYKVLQRVRLPDTSRNIWADSICINQKNLQEKSRQVTIMGRIYRKAERVLIYMGSTGQEHGPEVLSLLQDVRDMINMGLAQVQKSLEAIKISGYSDPETDIWDTFPHSEPNALVLRDPRWASVCVLVEQEWFHRGWVVREAGLAQEGVVIWGQTEFKWDDLMRALVWRHRRAFRTIAMPAEDRIRSHLEAYEARHQDTICVFYQWGSYRACSLLDYLHCARALRLKDPRDRIYAFLDLAEDSIRELDVVPNYNDPPLKVYHDFAINYIRTIENVEILNYVKHDESSLKSCFMSWAPDWSKEEDDFAVVDGTTLKANGVMFDTVRCAFSVLQSGTTTSAVLYELWASIRNSISESPYATPNLLEPFFDTLTILGYVGELNAWHRDRKAYINTFERLHTQNQKTDGLSLTTDEAAKLESTTFHSLISSASSGKKLIVSERGYIGMAPAVAQKGDLCAIIFGCSSPCLLRTTGTANNHVYLGSSTIPGKESCDLGENGIGFYSCFGVESSKDWVDWGAEEQSIYLV